MRTQIETDEQDITQAKIDRDDYFLAMINADTWTCEGIENSYGLCGYPPELVQVGLNAAVEGKDPEEAVETYIVNRMLENN